MTKLLAALMVTLFATVTFAASHAGAPMAATPAVPAKPASGMAATPAKPSAAADTGMAKKDEPMTKKTTKKTAKKKATKKKATAPKA